MTKTKAEKLREILLSLCTIRASTVIEDENDRQKVINILVEKFSKQIQSLYRVSEGVGVGQICEEIMQAQSDNILKGCTPMDIAERINSLYIVVPREAIATKINEGE